ncbi:unnamed protein product [Amoebophrya sp. A25]|nr:unnamed protein product [Amoebophrya sp. A25]|eukprot:GSA25T00007442001.1
MGDILNRTGKEGSVLLREETIKLHRDAAAKQRKDDNLELRVRKAGAFKRLEPVRHLPIKQEDVNDNSWDVTLTRIGKVVTRQAETRATQVPHQDKYKYWNGMPNSLNMKSWMGTRQMSTQETPLYGSTYKMEVGGEPPYLATHDVSSPKSSTQAQTK